ncbi:hypothetical protein TorRG33x02_250930 [Trema orientale]|uniref:Uncharacterized protein n=1 Tax=Trema orientale TaxID=63057 RepID=A0A2P5DHW4_TREOI|nr:hypothetical protein TorRG33x02_250930 [Trema orientale]
MKSQQSPFRAVGQRSIVSSFLTPSSNPVPKEDSQKNKASEKGSRVSLSDFLHRKLHEDSRLPTTVKGKAKPFLSLLGPKNLSGSTDEKLGAKKDEVNSVVEKVVLEQFKHIDTVKQDCLGSSSNGEAESCNITHVQESRKRKSFEDANGGGWWDSNMEGVDNEEVGFSEVWEGVGSTTFGETIDWH